MKLSLPTGVFGYALLILIHGSYFSLYCVDSFVLELSMLTLNTAERQELKIDHLMMHFNNTFENICFFSILVVMTFVAYFWRPAKHRSRQRTWIETPTAFDSFSVWCNSRHKCYAKSSGVVYYTYIVYSCPGRFVNKVRSTAQRDIYHGLPAYCWLTGALVLLSYPVLLLTHWIAWN